MKYNDKTNRLAFRCTDRERKTLEIISRRENLDISSTIRLLIREGAQKRELNPIGLVTLPKLKNEVQNE